MAKKDKKTPNGIPAEEETKPVEKQPADGAAPIVTEENDEAAEAATEAQPDSFTLSREEFDEVKAHIASLQKEKDEMTALAQRTQADFDNFRRRNATVRTDGIADGKRELLTQLLPVLDNFDRAIEADDGAADPWREGVKLVWKQMHDTLAKLGMTEVPTDGAFDPDIHNAVMQEKVEGKESGTILMVLQKGYRLNDRILRHAMVKVAE